ncbi:MAG TPA: hypothetical protein PK948_06640 [Gemmatimonadales bacterium]|nr:hypothetical protein [Gemmatimonadales bacterium]
MSPANRFRRNDILQATPAEAAIRAAMVAVEALPADTRLTDAVVKLQEALDRVADFVDGVDRRPLPLMPMPPMDAEEGDW